MFKTRSRQFIVFLVVAILVAALFVIKSQAASSKLNNIMYDFDYIIKELTARPGCDGQGHCKGG